MKVMIISDGTGETATVVTRAALAQFEDETFQFTRFKNVRSQNQIDAILETNADQHQLIAYTVVSEDLRDYILEKTAELGIPAVDVIGPLLSKVEKLIHQNRKAKPGIFRAINDSYFDRIDAMEFTVRADDGKNVKLFQKADLILVGISRTSKTPLSIYLSHQGFKVANLPLIPGVQIPPEIEDMDQSKFIGLTIDPQALLDRLKRKVHGGKKTSQVLVVFHGVLTAAWACSRQHKPNLL